MPSGLGACFGTGGGGRIRIASQAFIALQVIKSVVSWSFYAPYTVNEMYTRRL